MCLRRNKKPVEQHDSPELAAAKEHLAHTREDEVTVSKIVDALKDKRVQNHFGVSIADTFRGAKK